MSLLLCVSLALCGSSIESELTSLELEIKNLTPTVLVCPAAEKQPTAFTDSGVPDGRENIQMEQYEKFVAGKKGLEIGGPSGIFTQGGLLPLYQSVGDLDNAVFDGNTLWAKGLQDGGKFHFEQGKAPGRTWLRDGTNLEGVADNSYDFVLSSHNLEHMANPLKAMAEYVRVLKPGGALITILPYAPRTFDHNRSPTKMDKLLSKWRRGVAEDDLSELEEILANHDLKMDVYAPQTVEGFRERSMKNYENRGLHQHVFNFELISQVHSCFGVQPKVANLVDINQILLGVKDEKPPKKAAPMLPTPPQLQPPQSAGALAASIAQKQFGTKQTPTAAPDVSPVSGNKSVAINKRPSRPLQSRYSATNEISLHMDGEDVPGPALHGTKDTHAPF